MARRKTRPQKWGDTVGKQKRENAHRLAVFQRERDHRHPTRQFPFGQRQRLFETFGGELSSLSRREIRRRFPRYYTQRIFEAKLGGRHYIIKVARKGANLDQRHQALMRLKSVYLTHFNTKVSLPKRVDLIFPDFFGVANGVCALERMGMNVRILRHALGGKK